LSSHSTSPFLWRVFFWARVSRTIWSETASSCDPPDRYLLEARITGMSHWWLANLFFLIREGFFLGERHIKSMQVKFLFFLRNNACFLLCNTSIRRQSDCYLVRC
jgi:hypothetical protein